MPELSASNEMQTLTDAVGLYDPSAPKVDAVRQLLALADVIRLATDNSISLQGGLERTKGSIDAIQEGLRSSLGPVIGMLLGRIAPTLLREIDQEIATHRGTIERGEPDADAAQWNIGRLEHRKKTVEALFERFVRQGEDL